MRWGVLATGGIAHTFASALRTAGIDLVAVGSRQGPSARQFAERFDIARWHDSYERLAADPDVDIVYIATPHPFHLENALLMLDHGKHVLVEKPFALNAVQAETIRVAAAERGLLAMEAMWTRYLPHMVRVRELVRCGALGDVRALTATHAGLLPVDPRHRINAPGLGGGALLDLGIYPVSFAWDMLGAPTSMAAQARLGETGVDTEVATVFTHGSGALSTTLSSSRSEGTTTAHILGTDARIDIDDTWYRVTDFRLIAPGGRVIETYESHVDGNGMQYQALAAERYIADGLRDSPVLPLAQVVAILGTLDDIRAQIGLRYPDETENP